LISIFSAGDATKKHLSSTQFILALCHASTIASSTISTQTNSSHTQDFKKDNQILQAQQYKSKMFHSIRQAIFMAVQNSF
jgi:hypothetical protein